MKRPRALRGDSELDQYTAGDRRFIASFRLGWANEVRADHVVRARLEDVIAR